VKACFAFDKLVVFTLSFFPSFSLPCSFSFQPDQFLELTQLATHQEHEEEDKNAQMCRLGCEQSTTVLVYVGFSWDRAHSW